MILSKTIADPGPGSDQPLTFQRDHHLRRTFFVEESFEHKARSNLYWLAWLLDQTTDLHDIVLDPMGGAGSILLATLKQRPVITGDIEPHWAQLQRKNLLRIRDQMLFQAPAYVHQWDAAKLPLPSSWAPAIVTSPPYFDLFSNWNRKSGGALDGRHVKKGVGLCYGFHQRQIGNVHVYEDYLDRMRRVYLECWRVLRPRGILVLIVGDRVRKKARVPVTADTETLCRALGFRLVDTHQRQTIPSRFRRIHAQQQGDGYPQIDVETALVFRKPDHPPRPKLRFALLEAPSPDSSPGRQLFDKVLAYALATADRVLVLTESGLLPVTGPNSVSPGDRPRGNPSEALGPNLVWRGDHPRKARQRREWACSIVADIVSKHGLGAGDEVSLHVTLRYAPYLQQRLNTLGCACAIPTSHCNLGQKLAWYTEALRRIGSRPTSVSPDVGPERL